MRNAFNLRIALFLGVLSNGYAWTLKTGSYQLDGSNHSAGNGYKGEVIIEPQGENYKLIWTIGKNQWQYGVGILQDDILSVAFIDQNNHYFWGVVSFRVRPFGKLEGLWTSFDGTTQKKEHLVWKGSSTY